MMFPKHLLSGVLLACCFGALACSDEKAAPSTSIDSGLDEPEDEDDEDEESEEEEPVAKPKDAGPKKDAGRDAGGDAGTSDARVRGIDSGSLGETGSAGGSASNGPEVVDAEREPVRGGQPGDVITTPANDAPLVDADGEPAFRTVECPLLAYTLSGKPQALIGCCLSTGDCGTVTVTSPQTCETPQGILARLENAADVTYIGPSDAKCDYAAGR